MADITEFKSRLMTGGARSNQFRVHITFPNFVDDVSEELQFLAKSSSLPASNLADVSVMYRGRAVHFAGEREFEPWTIEVYNDNNFNVRNAFEMWVDYIQNAESSNGETVPRIYQQQMQVIQLDRNDDEVKTYQFVDAWPINIGAIQLSWDANNEIETFPVTFQYNYWTSPTGSIGGQTLTPIGGRPAATLDGR